ncbi:hypothetical protein [Nocardia sp. NPDC003963]
MSNSHIRKAIFFVAPALGAFGMILPATAGADPGQGALLPPIVEFTPEKGGGVYGKVENPNDHGVCWAENADTGAVFTVGAQYHDFSVEESVAGPGQTQFKSLRGLNNGPVRVIGRCATHLPPAADDPEASASEVVTVEVSGAGIPTGSSGG